jgi:hypothetical protein
LPECCGAATVRPWPKRGSWQNLLAKPATPAPGRSSALLDTRVVYCGGNLEQLAKPALSLPNGLPDACVDLIYIDPAPVSEAELTSASAIELPFNSNRSSVHYV